MDVLNLNSVIYCGLQKPILSNDSQSANTLKDVLCVHISNMVGYTFQYFENIINIINIGISMEENIIHIYVLSPFRIIFYRLQ